MSEKSQLQDLTPQASLVSNAKRDSSLVGLRGLLAAQTLVFITLQVFLPSTVPSSTNRSGPRWQLILRDSLANFLWNPTLIFAGFIILSARTICLPFLHNPNKLTIASIIFRRSVRLLIPLSIALAVATAVQDSTKNSLILRFKDITNNESLPTPYKLPSALTYFNALFNLFWTTRFYSDQAASKAFYNDSLWSISAIYTQSFTVYLAAVIVPFTRPQWRLGVWLFFALAAWWVQSLAWFSISGLLLADAIANMKLRETLTDGVHLRVFKQARHGGWTIRIPGWLFGLILVVTGGVVKYFWKEWRPNFSRSGPSDVAQPEARDDDFLIIIGVMLGLESLPWLRSIVGCRVLVAIGQRSLSLYITGSIIMNTMAVALFLHFVDSLHMTFAAASGVSVLISLVIMSIFTEMFYRFVEIPTRWAGEKIFVWLLD